jgi:hypothetical protein
MYNKSRKIHKLTIVKNSQAENLNFLVFQKILMNFLSYRKIRYRKKSRKIFPWRELIVE